MVLSKIDKTVSYSEIKTIEDQDVDFNSTMYIAEIHDQNCLIALGTLNKKYEAKNIYYIPIYLVNNTDVIAKIGVFELSKDNEPIIYDPERDFDISKLDFPLFFGFVTKEYVIKNVKDLNIPEFEDESYVEEQEKEVNDVLEPTKSKGDSLTGDLKFPFEDDNEDLVDIEGETEANSEKENFDEDSALLWMQKYMKNMNYDIKDVEANGDCFFAVIRDSFSGIPLEVSVKELREVLVDHFDEEAFKVREERFNMFKNALEKAKLEKKKVNSDKTKKRVELLGIFKENEKLSKDKSLGVPERNKYAQIAVKAKKDWGLMKKKFAIMLAKKSELLKLAEEDYKSIKIMENISTIEQFKEKIKTTEYWADEWAIKKLESLLNIKFIIFSKEKFEEGEVENVLHCGGEFSEHIKKKGTFKPKFYILTVHTGNHYKLVTYKDRRIFKFNEIPYDVKQLIKSKCMETSKNSEWNYIPKFKNMDTSIKPEKKKESDDEEEEESNEKKESSDEEGDDEKEKKVSKKKIKISKKTSKSLYNDEVVFQFYSGSADKPKPGKGSGESIKDSRIPDFKELELAENKGWRKVLSNFYISPIQIDGKQWNSVEHYFQAAKFKEINPDYYFKFSLDDASSTINKDPAKAKKAGRKVKLDKDQIKKWNSRSSSVMKKAQMEKYRTNDYARKILLLTKDAKLMHYMGRASGVIEFKETMEIRNELMKKQ